MLTDVVGGLGENYCMRRLWTAKKTALEQNHTAAYTISKRTHLSNRISNKRTIIEYKNYGGLELRLKI